MKIMTTEIKFDLNNPPDFNQLKLFSIDANVTKAQGTSEDWYFVIHRLPFGNYSKGAIFVVGVEFGLPFESERERHEEFEGNISQLFGGAVVEHRRGRGGYSTTNIIVPQTELTTATILQNIGKYNSIDKVLSVVPSYRILE